MSSLFSCLSLGRLCLLLLMSNNVYHNPIPVLPCLVCAGNVTWMGGSVQCCIYSKWVHLKCLQLSFSRFKTLKNSHSRSGPPASCGDPTPTNTATSSSDSSSLYTSIVQYVTPLPHFHPPSLSKLFGILCIYSLCTLTIASCSWLFLYHPLLLLAP